MKTKKKAEYSTDVVLNSQEWPYLTNNHHVGAGTVNALYGSENGLTIHRALPVASTLRYVMSLLTDETSSKNVHPSI